MHQRFPKAAAGNNQARCRRREHREAEWALHDAFPNPGISIAVSSRWSSLTFINDSMQPRKGGEQEEDGLRAEQMGHPTAEGFEFEVPGGSAGDGDWPQTRTRVLVVFPEPHLKFGHDALKTKLCRHKACGTAPAVSPASSDVSARCRATLGGPCSIANVRSPHISHGKTWIRQLLLLS